jgi:SagB-type dehydrogenase family enzyme
MKYITNPDLLISPKSSGKVENSDNYQITLNDISILGNYSFVKILMMFQRAQTIDHIVDLVMEDSIFEQKNEIVSLIYSLIEQKLIVPEEDAEVGIFWQNNGWSDAWIFHQSTRNQYFNDSTPDTAWEQKNTILDEYLEQEDYPSAALDISALQEVELGEPAEIHGEMVSLSSSRRTVRNFIPDEIDLSHLSAILKHATQSILTTRQESENAFKTDRAMLLHSWLSFMEIGVYIHKCQGLAQGLYFFDLQNQKLRLVKKGDFSETVDKATWKQGVEGATVTVFFMADLKRYMWKYRNPRHYKAVWVQSASLAHRIIMLSHSFGYGTFQSPAMHDQTALKMFDVTASQLMPIYMVGFGPYKKGKSLDQTSNL